MFLGAALGAVVIHYLISAVLWLATGISAVWVSCSFAPGAHPIGGDCSDGCSMIALLAPRNFVESQLGSNLSHIGVRFTTWLTRPKAPYHSQL